MTNADELVGNAANDNSVYCLAQPGQLYLVYLPEGCSKTLDLTAAPGDYTVSWFNPREGGPLSARTGGTPAAVTPSAATTGAKLTLSAPSADDWLAVVRRK